MFASKSAMLTGPSSATQKLRRFVERVRSWRKRTTVYSDVHEDSATTLPVFGTILSEQIESTEHPGVPRVLVDLIKALRLHGLDAEGLYRVPGRVSKVREITMLANSNANMLFNRLTSNDQRFDGRAISSAIKHYLATLSGSLLDAEAFAWVMAKDLGRPLRTPAGLARTLLRVLDALEASIGCPGGKTAANDRERGWHRATLDYLMCHLREVVGLQARNRMSPRALALCLSPSLFGTTNNAETNSQVLEFLIEHWSWLSDGLHRGSQPVSVENAPGLFVGACVYACRYLRGVFCESLYSSHHPNCE